MNRTPQEILETGAGFVSERELTYLVECLETWRRDAIKRNAHANALEKRLRELIDSIGIVDDDPRLRYIVCQIGPEELREAKDLLARLL